MEMTKFNLNQYVHVKLTEIGIKELKRQSQELADFANCPEMSNPRIDNIGHGWSKWQAWDLFSKLGHMLKMGMGQPFETEIKISKKF